MSQSLITREELRQSLADDMDHFRTMLPARLSFERFVELAELAIWTGQNLRSCTPMSIVQSLHHCANYGLEPGREVALVDFGGVCRPIITYFGTLTLLQHTPGIRNCFAEVVYSEDEFHLDLGEALKPLTHVPARRKRETVEGAYGALVFRAGGMYVHYMTVDDLERARKASKLAERGPWKEHRGEMMRKSALKNAAKYCPLTPQVQAAFVADLEEEPLVSKEQARQNIHELFDRHDGRPEPQGEENS
jgi:recombination protein RecT